MTTLTSRWLACIIFTSAMLLAVAPAQAELLNINVSISPPGGGAFIESTSITTMAYVTNSPITGQKAYIEIIGSTATGGFQLRIQSKDQLRVLAFWEQITQATAAHQQFQITSYAIRTFQVGDVAGYVGDLDTGWNYFILF